MSPAILILSLAICAPSRVLSRHPGIQASQIAKGSDVNAVYAAILGHLRGLDPRLSGNMGISQETQRGETRNLSDKSVPPEWRSTVDDYRKKNTRVSLIIQVSILVCFIHS